ncbi:MAG: hypothetical protein JW702_10990 [Clostridiales bacterium]|nr:hypothetical protein [Clostridiales bacterium]
MSKSTALPENHFSLTSIPNVGDICKPLFDNTDIKYFHYSASKYFPNYCLTTLITSSKWHQCYWEESKKLVPNQKTYYSNLLKSSIYLLSAKETQAAILAKQYCHINDFVQLLTKTKEGYEELAFTTYEGNSILNFCFNHRDLLYQFGLYFKEKARDLIKQSQQHPIDISNLVLSPTAIENLESKPSERIAQKLLI